MVEPIKTFIRSDLGEEGFVAKDLLEEMERALNCAGMCDPAKHFMFSKVSWGVPPMTCQEAIHDDVHLTSKYVL